MLYLNLFSIQMLYVIYIAIIIKFTLDIVIQNRKRELINPKEKIVLTVFLHLILSILYMLLSYMITKNIYLKDAITPNIYNLPEQDERLIKLFNYLFGNETTLNPFFGILGACILTINCLIYSISSFFVIKNYSSKNKISVILFIFIYILSNALVVGIFLALSKYVNSKLLSIVAAIMHLHPIMYICLIILHIKKHKTELKIDKTDSKQNG